MGSLLRTGVVALACAALVASCGGDDDDAGSAQTTPEDVRTAIFERSFSECGSESLAELAGKHHVAKNSAAVSTAVARFWAEHFGGREDAVREARLACLQSMALDAPPGQTKKKTKKKTTTAKVP